MAENKKIAVILTPKKPKFAILTAIKAWYSICMRIFKNSGIPHQAKMKIPKEIIANIDFMNTLQGGRIEPEVNVKHDENGYEVLLKLPSVEAEKLQVEVVENRLWVYYLLPVLTKSNEPIQSPFTVASLMLPNTVDIDEISAKYEENHWRIFMPHNNMANGFRRKVDIEK